MQLWEKQTFEIMQEKGQNTGHSHFLYVPQCVFRHLPLSQTSPGFNMSAVQVF